MNPYFWLGKDNPPLNDVLGEFFSKGKPTNSTGGFLKKGFLQPSLMAHNDHTYPRATPSRNVIFGSDGYGCKVLIIEIRLGHIVLFFCVGGGGGMEILSITA